MKKYSPFIGLFVLSISTAAIAQQGSSCLADSAKLGPGEKVQFMQSCLAQLAQPSNVEEERLKHRTARCTQGAKNKNLHGKEHRGYLDRCISRNDAAEAYAGFTR